MGSLWRIYGQRIDIINLYLKRMTACCRGARTDGGRPVSRLLQLNFLLDNSSWMSQRYLKLNKRHPPFPSPQKSNLALLHCCLSQWMVLPWSLDSFLSPTPHIQFLSKSCWFLSSINISLICPCLSVSTYYLRPPSSLAWITLAAS